VSDHPLGKLAGYVALITGSLALLGALSSRFAIDRVVLAAGVVCAVLLSGWAISEVLAKEPRGSRLWAVVIAAGCLVLVAGSALTGEWGVVNLLGVIAITGGVVAFVSGQFERYEAEHSTCPHCSERIKATASRCKHCHQEVTPVTTQTAG
jgi:hypothetical protein